MLISSSTRFVQAPFNSEAELENVVVQNYEYIFGPSSIYLPKEKISTPDGAATIPDGLRAWVIMPNHVHVLFKVGTVSLAEIVGAWKKHTGRLANKLLGKKGAFWAEDYFDTYMRDAEHEGKTVRYIENNPTKAKLVVDPKEWPWSSARFRDEFGRRRL